MFGGLSAQEHLRNKLPLPDVDLKINTWKIQALDKWKQSLQWETEAHIWFQTCILEKMTLRRTFSETSDPMLLKLSAKYVSKRKDLWFSNFPFPYLKLRYPLVLVPLKVVPNRVDTGCH